MVVVILISIICLGLEIVAVERNIEATNRSLEDVKSKLDRIIKIIEIKHERNIL